MQEIKFDERNYRKHSKKNKSIIKKSLEELGAGRSVVIDSEDCLVAGNGVYEQAQALKMPVRVVETDGSELVVVKRTDLKTADEKRKKLALADNAASDTSEFDVDLLREDWEPESLKDWGIFLTDLVDFDKLIEQASSVVATREYSEDTNYNLEQLYRSKISGTISDKIERGIADGQIRSEIAEVLRARASQCTVFNFDELIKYYRSKDATETEKELLRRLYLVFVAPKELFESAALKVSTVSNEIYDDELQSK